MSEMIGQLAGKTGIAVGKLEEYQRRAGEIVTGGA